MSSARLPSSSSDVDAIRIFVLGQHGFQDLRPGSTVFNCTSAMISLGLDILQARSSVLALKKVIRRIIEANQDVPDLRNLGEADLEPKINEFLHSVRRSFPHVVVTNRFGMVTKNGRTNKQDCRGVFHAKTAAVIELNEMVSSSDDRPKRVSRCKELSNNKSANISNGGRMSCPHG